MFPSIESALAAYAIVSQEAEASQTFTHELEWRFIYHNRESKRRQLFGLLLLPLGHIRTSHAEFRFKTRHYLPGRAALSLTLGRSVGSIAYHLCFIVLLGSGVGVVVTAFQQAVVGVSWRVSLLTAAFVILAAIAAAASGKTRSLGLRGSARLIAKDSFDLLAIRRIKVPNKSPEPTQVGVTPRAGARVAPPPSAAQL
jgi:hypothetical protein